MSIIHGTSSRNALAVIAAGLLTAGCQQSPAPRAVTVTMHHISAEGIGAEAGTLTFTETNDGYIVTPNLHGFRPGFHAFHAHEKASCEPAIGESGKMESGRAAGPHYNGPAGQPMTMTMPDGTKMDGMAMDGMSMDGMATPAAGARMVMRGDMPQLTAAADGTITTPVVKTGLPFDEVLGHAVMMHPYGEAGLDPERPADSSATVRIACAILPK